MVKKVYFLTFFSCKSPTHNQTRPSKLKHISYVNSIFHTILYPSNMSRDCERISSSPLFKKASSRSCLSTTWESTSSRSSMTTSNKLLVELSILKERMKSAQARKAVALFGKHIYLVSFWHQRACKILAGLE